MRTYKTIERPSQVLGIDIQNLFVVGAFLIGSGVIVGFGGLIIPIHYSVYLIILAISLGLFILFKYLAKNRPPGFAMGFISFHIRQPKRLSVGVRRRDYVRTLQKK